MMTEHKLFRSDCRLISSKQLSEKTFLHEYNFPELANTVLPGQFLQLRISPEYTPFLPRPFSILDVNREKGSIFILFKIFGEATELLARKQPGDSVAILGPLGNTFSTENYNDLFLVAGGIGIPPIYFLIKAIEHSRFSIKLFLGAASEDDLFLLDEFNKMDFVKEYATVDGSYGKKGNVTEALENYLEKLEDNTKACVISCGPMPMLAEVQRLSALYNVRTQLSVETIMACGIGICQGCILPKRITTGNTSKYTLVCVEGPIYDGEELIF